MMRRFGVAKPAGHASHARELGRSVGHGENLEDVRAIHMSRIASMRPPGKCRAA